jgi:ribose-phosphate pyrophosphokinase
MHRLKKFAFLGATFGALMTTPWKLAYQKKTPSDEGDIISYEGFSDHIVHDLSKVKLFSINKNRDMANEIAFHLNTRLSKLRIFRISEGNDSYIEILENVRSKHVYLICCFSSEQSLNTTLIDLFLAISAAKRASASKVIVVMPYYAYTRQNDINHRNRKSYFAADIAQLLEVAGADRVITGNQQTPSSHGFFNIPIVEVDGFRAVTTYYRDYKFKDLVVVCPNDKLFQHCLNVKLHLEEIGHKNVDIGFFALTGDQKLQYIGAPVKDRDVLIIDSIIDTGGTLVKSAANLHALGANNIYAFGVHGVFAGEAREKIEKSHIQELVVTNTVPIDISQYSSKINQVSIAKMLAEAIAQTSFNKPLDQLKKEGII